MPHFSLYSLKKGLFFRPWLFIVLSAFLVNLAGPVSLKAEEFHLPLPGVMVQLSPPMDPPMMRGIKVHPDNPLRFDFILDRGKQELSPAQIEEESSLLIKYFLASLTVPEKDLWVNLSPYEKDRIIPQSFGLTEMGRDLLAEDYLLKQITASLIYPEGETGRKFWARVYAEAAKRYGKTDVAVNTFNKVWIVPQKAVVYENAKAGTAYVVDSKLKVMLEQDYLSLNKHNMSMPLAGRKDAPSIGSNILREIVIPELTREVNEDKNFAPLRQVYTSLILAAWYKQKVKDSIFARVYADKDKIVGVNIDDPDEKEKIYQRYLQAFKKGVYNFIQEEQDPMTQQMIPRKYFSGGMEFTRLATSSILQYTSQKPSNPDNAMQVTVDMAMANAKSAIMLPPQVGRLLTQEESQDIDKKLEAVFSSNISLGEARAVRAQFKQAYPYWDFDAALELPPAELVRNPQDRTFTDPNYEKNQRSLRGQLLLFLLLIADKSIDTQFVPLKQWSSKDVEVPQATHIESLRFGDTITIKDFLRALRVLHRGFILGINGDSLYRPPTSYQLGTFEALKGAAGQLNFLDRIVKDYPYQESSLAALSSNHYLELMSRYRDMLQMIAELNSGGRFGQDRGRAVAQITELYMRAVFKHEWIFPGGTGSNAFILNNMVNMFLRLNGYQGISARSLDNVYQTGKYSRDDDQTFLEQFLAEIKLSNVREDLPTVREAKEMIPVFETAEHDRAMSGFMAFHGIEMVYGHNKDVFSKGWWIGFDMDKATHIDPLLRPKAIGILHQIILNTMRYYPDAQFFSTEQVQNFIEKEEGYIYIPEQISRQELSIRLSMIRNKLSDETEKQMKLSQTVSFAAIRGDVLAANVSKSKVPGQSPQKEIGVLTSMMTEMLKSAKTSVSNYGNKTIFKDAAMSASKMNLAKRLNLKNRLQYDSSKVQLWVDHLRLARRDFGNNNDVFHYDSDGLKLAIRIAQVPGINLSKQVPIFNQLAAEGIAPRVYSHGFINGDKQNHYYLAVDWIEGLSIEKTPELTDGQQKMFIELLKELLRDKVWLPDPKASQFIIGYRENDPLGSRMTRAWLGDAERAKKDNESVFVLANYYYKSIRNEMSWQSVKRDKILSFLQNVIDLDDGRGDIEGLPALDALLNSNQAVSNTGGIDLTPANMPLVTRMDSHGNDNNGIKFRLDPAMLARLQNAPGFEPVIVKVRPLADLQSFLTQAS